MSGQMYAGNLCATQLGGDITFEDCEQAMLLKISYRKDRDTVLLVLRNTSDGAVYRRVVHEQTIVTVENPPADSHYF